jgi:membrane fusion protein, hemolysin D
MNAKAERPGPLTAAYDDHSIEGAAILYSEPAPLLRMMILVMVALVLAVLVWSYFGHADVIVAAPGVVSPEDDVRRVYAPVSEGEIEKVLVEEGDPVEEGTAIARVRSREAIQLAANARQAALELAAAELEREQFPATMELMQREAERLNDEIQLKQNQLDEELTRGSANLREEQLARLAEARVNLESTLRTRDAARVEYEKYQAASQSGGIAPLDVEQKRRAYETAREAYQLAGASLRALEARFIEEAAKNRTDLQQRSSELEDLRIKHQAKLLDIDQADDRLELKYMQARYKEQAARSIRFEDSKEGNLLVVLSPVAGVIASIALSQAGDKLQPNVPLVTIADEDSRKVLRVDIAESDRGFLVEGRPVKMKFNAFPYQRHGFLNGTLEYISETTQRESAEAVPTYKGYVSLERDYYDVDGEQRPLRYGMAATAEIIVRERRMIEFALDPLRGV